MEPKPSPLAADPSCSIWQHKPWWCQPWSILLTGVVLIGLSWWLFSRLWLTLAVATAVGGWWLLFLVVVPRAYRLAESQSLRPPAA